MFCVIVSGLYCGLFVCVFVSLIIVLLGCFVG